MKVILDKIERLQNGAAHLVFFTDINTHFTGRFSFTVPKAFASTACRFIVENTFDYGLELDISIIPLSNGKEMMEITSYIPNDSKSNKVLRITEYSRENKDLK
jgi:hypothetical protein